MECEQGILQIQLALQHLRLQTLVGRLLRANMEGLQLLAGVTYPIFEEVHTTLSYLPSMLWLSTLRKFLARIQGTLVTTIKPTVLWRDNDQRLMEVFCTDQFSQKPSRLQEMNNCCLFLQVETLADICDPDGYTLDPNMLQGHVSLLSSRSTKVWPRQTRPHQVSWGRWKNRILSNCALSVTRGNRSHYV